MRFEQADVLALPFGPDSFDAITVLHVGMNISDKRGLMRSLRRVLAPGGTVAVYDIMRVGDGDLSYPVPWASGSASSHLSTPDEYCDNMVAADLAPAAPVDRLDVVRSALERAANEPPPINLSHLMGEGWPTMFANLRTALDEGIVSPTQIIARRDAGS
ncbi:MAG: class I SAM-dependent methyltransferase [Actinomycetota bacterium]